MPTERRPTLISAHKTGGENNKVYENSISGIKRLSRSNVDYIEIDVQMTSDQQFVLHHDPFFSIGDQKIDIISNKHVDLVGEYGICDYFDAIKKIKESGKKVHIDLKFFTPESFFRYPGRSFRDTPEFDLVSKTLEIIPPSDFIVTTHYDSSVRIIRTMFKKDHPEIKVGISFGMGLKGRNPMQKMAIRFSETIGARKRLERSDANLIVANKKLAKMYLYRLSLKMNLPILIWTVDDENEMKEWIEKGVFLITTNFPQSALRFSRR